MVALEKLLAKCEASKQRCDRIPHILKRFRQSILAAACSGRLTADWRAQNLQCDSLESWKEEKIGSLLSEDLANGRSVVDAQDPSQSFPV